MQRAFPIGGAKDVPASLWKVDDEATTLHMNLLYDHLEETGEPALETGEPALETGEPPGLSRRV